MQQFYHISINQFKSNHSIHTIIKQEAGASKLWLISHPLVGAEAEPIIPHAIAPSVKVEAMVMPAASLGLIPSFWSSATRNTVHVGLSRNSQLLSRAWAAKVTAMEASWKATTTVVTYTEIPNIFVWWGFKIKLFEVFVQIHDIIRWRFIRWIVDLLLSLER